MTYKEDGKERSVFDDTVIVFTSTNGARTPEVENWKKASAKRIFREKFQLKALYVSEPWIWRGLQQAPERRPGGPLGRRNQDSCFCIKFGQGLPENDKVVCFPSLQKKSLSRSLDGDSSLKKC